MIENDNDDEVPCEGIDLQGNTGVIEDDNILAYENTGMITSDIMCRVTVEVLPMEIKDEAQFTRVQNYNDILVPTSSNIIDDKANDDCYDHDFIDGELDFITENKHNYDDYDCSSSDINSYSSRSVSNSEDDDDGSDDLDMFMRSQLTKEHIDDEDAIMIDDRENVMNQLIITGVECTSSLISDEISKTNIIPYDTHAEDVQSNGHNADLIVHDECRRDSKGGGTKDKTCACLLCIAGFNCS